MTSFANKFVGAIDQGTTSSRFILFNQQGDIVSVAQEEFPQYTPNEGECEHDAMEILTSVNNTIRQALQQSNPKNTLGRDIAPDEVACVGITNQRETTVVWNRATGKPYHNALVWMDMRTKPICDDIIAEGAGQDQLRSAVGLPISPYFAGTKLKWLLAQPDSLSGAGTVGDAALRGEVMFGTIDSWLVWNLTGGTNGGVHVTDVTNASRTMMMNINTCTWNDAICKDVFGVPTSVLPAIKSSSEVYGTCAAGTALPNVPLSGILGDQQAALFGQAAYNSGQAKNTYGTGCFMLVNTGTDCVPSRNGLLTTVAYKLGPEAPTVYALEGSVAFAGAAVGWLRDKLEIIESPADVSAKAASDNGGVYFVPAFSGLYAPYWKDHARGAILGLTRYANKGHLLRATMEAVCFQAKEVFDAMVQDCEEEKIDVKLTQLKVDGGMTVNEDIMQAQADILGTEVVRPVIVETTALGAAYAAGLAIGYWTSLAEIETQWKKDRVFVPAKSFADEYGKWKRAVRRTQYWECDEADDKILAATD